MPNITLSVDNTIIQKVRKIAVDKNTTMTAMIRDYLTNLAENHDLSKQQAIEKLEQ